jgi:hypothetical protein
MELQLVAGIQVTRLLHAPVVSCYERASQEIGKRLVLSLRSRSGRHGARIQGKGGCRLLV